MRLVGWISLTPALLGGERGWGWSLMANGQWFNQSCLCNGASRKSSKGHGSKSFQADEHVETWGDSPGVGMEAPCPFPNLALCLSSIGLFLSYISCYNKPVI